MSFFGRIANRAGAAATPGLIRAVPKSMAGRASLRRQAAPEEEMQTLRRQEVPEEEEMQPLRRQEEEDEMQTLRRQEMSEEEEMQMLRRQEEEEEEMQPLRRQEVDGMQAVRRQRNPQRRPLPRHGDAEAMHALRRQETLIEEETQMLRRQEEEEIQPLRRQEEEEEMQTLRRQEMPEEEDMQMLRRQEEDEDEMQALRQPAPRATSTAKLGALPKPPSLSALPDEPREMRGLRREVARGPGGTSGGIDAPGGPDAGPAATGAEADPPGAPATTSAEPAAALISASWPFGHGAADVAFEPGRFTAESRGAAEARPQVVIEQIEVMISEPANGAGGGRAAPGDGRRLKSRYLRGL